MTHGASARESLRQQGAKRLYPKITDPNFAALTALRCAITHIIDAHLPAGRKFRILDYGSGTAPYEPLFANRAQSYRLADLARNSFADVTVGPEGRLPLEEGSVDVVVSFQVLEHVLDFGAYLAECHRVLGDDGLLILSTHGLWPHHPDPVDVRRWTGWGLVHDLECHGFNSLEVVPCLSHLIYGTLVRSKWLGQQILPRFGLFGRLAAAIVTPWFQLSIAVGDWLTPSSVRMDNAVIYVVCARKTSAASDPGVPRGSA